MLSSQRPWQLLWRWCLPVWSLASVGAAWAQNVVFINPGKSNEAYWVAAADATQSAATSLGMNLEVKFAERNHLQAIAIAKEIAARPKAQQPRFVIFTNDYGTGPEILKALEAAGIDNFMAYSGIPESMNAQIGRPREKYRHWLGSLETMADDAGYLTAKALFAAARESGLGANKEGKLLMLAIPGDRSTTTSVERTKGMHKAVADAKDVVLVQEVYGEWRRDRAGEQARGLMQRYPEVRIFWAGNDEMAFGAMDAWRARGGKPGQDAFFSGINTSPAALTAKRTGELTALAGGHFMAGAFSMVMLYDYSKGKDFSSEGLELKKPMFVLFDDQLIDRFEQRVSMAKTPLNFRLYSKALNPKLTQYAFEMDKLLR